ncbi:pro-sigmaK processing inhibitor BofA [Cohnella kolymensis]|uniref:Pro-sigmaK processing inhibitor BofA n=1 Tax=Cohnella kolymensis TaxID=1590652 RepID=A0ABR5A1Q4_9BACL|nr:pro-sigmaK processing inhibitor BofA family protein [Cohnella kolymensis]KIL34583.1 pro-sigmaK processing inhibitor BofA [Cohnella kolymensis]
MKTFWLSVLAVSALLLILVLVREKAAKGWLTRFGIHLVVSAMALYALNFSGWITGWYVPLNPVTIGAVTLLGVPGIALVLGLQTTLLT